MITIAKYVLALLAIFFAMLSGSALDKEEEGAGIAFMIISTVLTAIALNLP